MSRSLLRHAGLLLRAHIHRNKMLLTSSSAAHQHPSPPEAAAATDAVHLTDNCIRRLKELHACSESPGEKMLRLSIETGGCSGFQYVFVLDDKKNADDRVFEKDGVKLIVDNISFDFVKGATIDYVEELIRSAFQVVSNPSAVGGCSCKSSFMVK